MLLLQGKLPMVLKVPVHRWKAPRLTHYFWSDFSMIWLIIVSASQFNVKHECCCGSVID